MANPLMLAQLSNYFVWWQIPLVILLIAIIIFWVIYRRRQM